MKVRLRDSNVLTRHQAALFSMEPEGSLAYTLAKAQLGT